MANKGSVYGEYEVTLVYEGLTIDELCMMLKLLDSGELYDYGVDSLCNLHVGKDYDIDCDGWSEPNGKYNISFRVGQCGMICKESWIEWYGKGAVVREYDDAEELKAYIKSKTGIE